MTALQIGMMIVWLSIILVSIIIEVMTAELVSVWFTLGALVALPFAFFDGFEWYYQVAIFFTVSCLALILFKIFWRKKLDAVDQPTNSDALVGLEVTLLADVDKEHHSEGKLHGVIWTIKSEEKIEKGTIVRISKVVGNSLIVIKIKEEN